MGEEELENAADDIRDDAYINEDLGSESDESDAMEKELELMEGQLRNDYRNWAHRNYLKTLELWQNYN